jgi:methanogenic corrinoid protein MtbC1
LAQLVGQARARNRSLNVTGMLLYDNGTFLQTIEGPPEPLNQLWCSIKQDSRHSDIEVLSEHLVPARVFSDWDLLLYSRGHDGRPDSVQAAQTPDAVADYIRRLVNLALDADDLAINELVDTLAQQGWTSDALVSLLIEPAARAMGDAWLDDSCTELDLTIGLSMLQLAGHAVRHSCGARPMRSRQFSILLAGAPGEPHMLGASLLADEFMDAGWQVDIAAPGSSQSLAEQIHRQQPDAVDIGLSDALPRHHALGTLRATIDRARLASSEHPTVISVGGRLFAEAAATASSVGADHTRTTAAGTSIRIAKLVRRQEQPVRDGN